MAVNLQKGQKVDLRKPDGNTLHKVMIGLGWDEVPRGGLFTRPQAIDCDASVILCIDKKLADKSDIIYFGNRKHKTGAVIHMGDNVTGAGDGDDERIGISLDALPQQYDRIGFVVNIYQAKQRKQHFGMIRNAFIRLVDLDSKAEIFRYNLSENYDGMTAMIFGELYKHNGAWKFNAMGQPTTDDGLAQSLQWFK